MQYIVSRIQYLKCESIFQNERVKGYSLTWSDLQINSAVEKKIGKFQKGLDLMSDKIRRKI